MLDGDANVDDAREGVVGHVVGYGEDEDGSAVEGDGWEAGSILVDGGAATGAGSLRIADIEGDGVGMTEGTGFVA